MIQNIKSIAVSALFSSVIVGATTWWFTASYKNAKFQAYVAARDSADSAELARVLNKAIETERAFNNLNSTLEKTHDENKNKINILLSDNRRFAKLAGGLRDPYAKGCPTKDANNLASVSSESTASGGLSDEATEFLLTIAADADRAAEYANSCQKWALETAMVINKIE